MEPSTCKFILYLYESHDFTFFGKLFDNGDAIQSKVSRRYWIAKGEVKEKAFGVVSNWPEGGLEVRGEGRNRGRGEVETSTRKIFVPSKVLIVQMGNLSPGGGSLSQKHSTGN